RTSSRFTSGTSTSTMPGYLSIRRAISVSSFTAEVSVEGVIGLAVKIIVACVRESIIAFIKNLRLAASSALFYCPEPGGDTGRERMILRRLTGLAIALSVAGLVSAATVPGEAPRSDFSTSAPLRTLLTIEPDEESHRNSEGDIIRLGDGRLALVYTRFSGGTSDHAAAYLALRTSADNGKTWTSDTKLLENEGAAN